MPRKKSTESNVPYRAIDPEARERQLINYAENLAEQKLLDGTASSQIICHYLSLASTKTELELELLRQKHELMKAQTDAVNAEKEHDLMYAEVLKALKRYNGNFEDDYEE